MKKRTYITQSIYFPSTERINYTDRYPELRILEETSRSNFDQSSLLMSHEKNR